MNIDHCHGQNMTLLFTCTKHQQATYELLNKKLTPCSFSAPEKFCGSPADSGYCGNKRHCRSVKMYYYNSDSGKCLKFIYYGSGGNYNRFSTKKDCEKTCRGTVS